MGRLIDADELKALVESLELSSSLLAALCIDEMKEMIDIQPTAYDVEKVEAEIHERLGCKDCEYADDESSACDMCIEIAVRDDVCEIIRKGGIDG